MDFKKVKFSDLPRGSRFVLAYMNEDKVGKPLVQGNRTTTIWRKNPDGSVSSSFNGCKTWSVVPIDTNKVDLYGIRVHVRNGIVVAHE